MKKIIFGLLFICSFVGISGHAEEKTYTIGIEADCVPYEFYDAEGRLTGFDVELLKEIAKEGGFQYQFHHGTFDNILSDVKEEKIDAVMNNVFINAARKKVYDFSNDYFDDGAQLGVLSNNVEIETIKDLKGKKIGVCSGTVFANYPKKEDKGIFKDNQIVEYETNKQMYLALRMGEVDALYTNSMELKYLIQQKEPYKMIEPVLHFHPIGMIVKKGSNHELLNKFNLGLEKVKENGTYKKIVDKYSITSYGLDDEMSFEDTKLPTTNATNGIFLPVVLVLAGALLLTWGYLIQDKMKQKEKVEK